MSCIGHWQIHYTHEVNGTTTLVDVTGCRGYVRSAEFDAGKRIARNISGASLSSIRLRIMPAAASC